MKKTACLQIKASVAVKASSKENLRLQEKSAFDNILLLYDGEDFIDQ